MYDQRYDSLGDYDLFFRIARAGYSLGNIEGTVAGPLHVLLGIVPYSFPGFAAVLLDGDCAELDTLQLQSVVELIATPGSMLQAQLDDPLLHLRRQGHGMGMVETRPVFHPRNMHGQ